VDALLTEAILQPQISCEELRDAFDLQPLTPVATPGGAGLEFTETALPTPDGEWLRVWYIPAPEPRGVIVMSPGAAGPMECYLYPVPLLVERGWSVVTFDYEGFGGSTGLISLVRLPDDLETVVDWTRAATGVDQVTLYGVSVGSIPSVAVAVRRPEVVNGLVLDSPVSLALQLDRFRGILGRNTGRFISALQPELVSEEFVRGVQAPLLLFVHDQDHITPPSTVQPLFENAPVPKRLVHFPVLGHARGLYFQTDAYMQDLESFLESVWLPTAAPLEGSETTVVLTPLTLPESPAGVDPNSPAALDPNATDALAGGEETR
jgi:pimeloyl-ACP methyl ester carboxylesterase